MARVRVLDQEMEGLLTTAEIRELASRELALLDSEWEINQYYQGRTQDINSAMENLNRDSLRVRELRRKAAAAASSGASE